MASCHFFAFLLTQKTIPLLLFSLVIGTDCHHRTVEYDKKYFGSVTGYADFIQMVWWEQFLGARKCYNVDAYPCDTVRPRCNILGTCCRRVSDVTNPVDIELVMTWTEEQRPKTTCLSSPTPGAPRSKIACIAQCHPDFQDDLTIERCKDPSPPILLENYTPVEDEESHLIFCNKFCAECNYIDKVSDYILITSK